VVSKGDRTLLLDQLDVLLSELVNMVAHALTESVRGKVSVSQFLVLKILSTWGKSSVSQVAARLQITMSAVTSLGDGLVRTGLVERTRDDKDRRVVWLELTEKGLALVRELEKHRRELMEKVVSTLSYDKLEDLVRILEEIVHGAGAARS